MTASLHCTADQIIAALPEIGLNELCDIKRALLDEIEAKTRGLDATGGLTPDEIAQLDARDLIGCIKLVRNRTGLGLREAKDYVDGYRARTRGGS